MAIQQMFLGAGGKSSTSIDEIFSVDLYPGDDTPKNITTGINMDTTDADGAHGMVWLKCRNYSSSSHIIYDTVRGAKKYLQSNSNTAQTNLTSNSPAVGLTGFTGANNDGFSLGYNWANENKASAGAGYPAGQQLAWSFKCSPKFFDIVQFTGNSWSGTSARTPTIAHNLGTKPGFIMVKRYDWLTGDWYVYHTALGGDYRRLELNKTDQQQPANAPNSTSYFASNSTHFDFNGGQIGGSGLGMIAYLFAEDEDNIKCGDSTSAGGASDWNTVELGWEPQWIMLKAVDSIGGWQVCDTERGINTPGNDEIAEVNTGNVIHYGDIFELYSTGFKYRTGYVGSGIKFAYVAIRKEE